MAKWEYTVELLDPTSLEHVQGELNRLGDEDWELVSLSTKMGHNDFWCVAVLKRLKANK